MSIIILKTAIAAGPSDQLSNISRVNQIAFNQTTINNISSDTAIYNNIVVNVIISTEGPTDYSILLFPPIRQQAETAIALIMDVNANASLAIVIVIAITTVSDHWEYHERKYHLDILNNRSLNEKIIAKTLSQLIADLQKSILQTDVNKWRRFWGLKSRS